VVVRRAYLVMSEYVFFCVSSRCDRENPKGKSSWQINVHIKDRSVPWRSEFNLLFIDENLGAR